MSLPRDEKRTARDGTIHRSLLRLTLPSTHAAGCLCGWEGEAHQDATAAQRESDAHVENAIAR